MIDCDVHVQITHPEEILKFIDEPEREWYRNQAYLLGLPGVRNYDGSWTEWGNAVRVPIEK